MNRSFKSIWSQALGTWVAVSEATRARGKTSSVCAALLPAVLLALSVPAGAQSIALTGDTVSTNPLTPSPWSAGPLTIGNTGTGTLSVLGGARVIGEPLMIGNLTGSNGTATFSGVSAGGVASAWVNSSNSRVTVGNFGTGRLDVLDGAQIATPALTLTLNVGDQLTGVGTVNLSGVNGTQRSSFYSGSLYIGGQTVYGKGVVNVTDGALLNFSATSYVGRGSASELTVSGVNGSYRSTLQSAGNLLSVGLFAGGAGVFNVLDGGYASMGNTVIGVGGSGAGATGTVNVSGTRDGYRSELALTVDKTASQPALGIGSPGSGTLNVSEGGLVTVNKGPIVVGDKAGGVGVVTLSTGGELANPGGGAFTVAGAAGSTGTLNIGAASGASAVAPGILSAPSIAFGAGTSTLNFNHTSSNGSYNFGAGVASGTGTGTINQLAGATNLTGDSSGFNGTTNVTSGTLGVTGKLGSATSTMNVTNGTLAVSGGGVVNSNKTGIAATAGDSGQVTVSGAGSSLTAQTGLIVGGAGNGSLAINNGASVTEVGTNYSLTPGNSLLVGGAAGGVGMVTVDGSGSQLAAGTIYLGGPTGATGTMTVSNGATVSAPKAGIGGNSDTNGGVPGGTGSLTVTGAGSTFSETSAGGGLFVGAQGGTGEVTVAKGGTLNSATAFLGFAGGKATATVSDAASTWNESGIWRVGYGTGASTTANVSILNGGAANVGSIGIFGIGSGGSATARVAGAGSVLSVGSAPYQGNTLGTVLGFGVDNNGAPVSGTLTVADGGVVNTPVVNLTYIDTGAPVGTTATGTFNIGAAAGSAGAAPGTLNSPLVAFGAGTGTLNFNHTNTTGYDVSVAMSGGGLANSSINQLAGNTNLTGNSSAFGGATNVTGGTLRVNGTLGNATSTVAVSNGATLGGVGTIGGSVAIGNGVLSPGNSPGTLTINGNLALASGSQLNYELGAANTAGGPLNDLTVVKGDLTLDGTLNVTQSAVGVYGAGIYRLIDYSGTLTNNGLELGNMPAGTNNYVQTSVAQQVNLVNSQGLVLNYWDGNAGGKNDSLIAGGNGTWLAGPTGTDRWTQADGAINAPYANGAFAVFTGAPGTVNVDSSLGQVAVSGMQFATSGYRIQGDSIALTPGTNAIRVGDGTGAGTGTTATIASSLIGAGRLDKVDLGTLVLAGTNSYSGGTQISDGTLQLGEGGTTGSLVGDITNNATLALNRSDANTLAGAISGSGAVTQIGSGNTTLAAVNTYAGGTTITAGTLTGSATSFGSGAITDNAALVLQQAGDATMANAINGTGTLTKTGAGALNYTGTGSLSGPTTVAQGTLAVNGSLANSAVRVRSVPPRSTAVRPSRPATPALAP